MVPECLHSGSLLQHLSEIMTTADAADSTVVEDILSKTNHFLSIEACNFIADKGYDVKAVYNLIKGVYHGECVIPLNKHNTKNPEKLPSGASDLRSRTCYAQNGRTGILPQNYK